MTSLQRVRPAGRFLAGAALALLAQSACAGPHAALRVQLRAASDVDAPHVRLGDIATVAGDDAELVARVSALEVGDVAPDGAPSVVERASLARWVRARAGVAPQDIAWSGAERCSVRHAAAETAPLQAAAAVDTSDAAHARPVRALVSRGRAATLRSVDGVIAVESKVEVREDGAAGQDVRVRLPGATADILARVSGPDRVEVVR